MSIWQPQNNAMWVNFAIFAVSAAVVWLAGTRLSRYARLIDKRTGAGQAVIGTVLLGAVVSLPEMVMATTAAWSGNAHLAVNILLGGVTMVMVVLALTDLAAGPEPLSSDIRKPVVLLQAIMVVALSLITAGAMTVGDVAIPVLGVGVWTTALLVAYGGCIVVIRRKQESRPWMPDPVPAEAKPATEADDEDRRLPRPAGGKSPRTWVIVAETAIAGLAVVAAGVLLSRTTDALAVQTKLGAGFAGLVLGGLITSLPELSTTITAVRLGQYEMAFSDAFGTNMFSLMLLFVADAAFTGEPILAQTGRFSLFATLLGAAVTCIYLAGLVARPKRGHLRMGTDSIIVLVVATIGLVLLYRIR